jgi:FlgD Ig-like domain
VLANVVPVRTSDSRTAPLEEKEEHVLRVRSEGRHPLQRRVVSAVALLTLVAFGAQPLWAGIPTSCTVPDNGTGTVDLPPNGCGYVSPNDLHVMIDGLPPGTTINIDAKHQDFFNVTRTPGGVLGGEIETFSSSLSLSMSGTGGLAGFNRIINVSAQCETHTAPRTPGSPQTFQTEMVRIQGEVTGDPDFDLLRITAGSGLGMPSPGQTTLTSLSGGNWNVDSFFDITYRIDFVGAPGSVLGGMSGSTMGTVRMRAGLPRPTPAPCTVADDGTGTVRLPPDGCGYVSPSDLHRMIDGLPPGTAILIDAKHDRFFNVNETPGGPLGGSVETFASGLTLVLQGTGGLSEFTRTLNVPVQCETHTAPRISTKPATGPGDPINAVQSFDTDMYRIEGQIVGDPDFDLLHVTAGTGFGMPSPGHTTLTQAVVGGNWNVDSFFDITYRIDFQGAAGGALDGMSGSTTATIRMQSGGEAPTDVVEDRPVPRVTALQQNVPNPFNPSTKIAFDIASPGKVRLLIVDVAGRLVRTLVDAQMMQGRYTMSWDGTDQAGRRVASGTYYYALETLDGKWTKSMVLMK